jgi:taurine dioxygenase
MFTAGENPVPHQPWLNLVSNVGRDLTSRSVFHTDTSYVAQPPAYTALKAILQSASHSVTLQAFNSPPSALSTSLAKWRYCNLG